MARVSLALSPTSAEAKAATRETRCTLVAFSASACMRIVRGTVVVGFFPIRSFFTAPRSHDDSSNRLLGNVKLFLGPRGLSKQASGLFPGLRHKLLLENAAAARSRPFSNCSVLACSMRRLLPSSQVKSLSTGVLIVASTATYYENLSWWW